MALKQLLKRNQLQAAKAAAEKHKEGRSAIEDRRDALNKREVDAEAALGELTEQNTAEERKAVEDEVDAIEAEKNTLDADEKSFNEEAERLDNIVAELEKEIAEMEERDNKPVAPVKKPEKRTEEKKYMEKRTFFGMNMEQRDAFFAREDVKKFLERVRTLAKERRSVSGADILIPNVMLEIVREQTAQASKLYKHVAVRSVPGTARQTIAGTPPEAVWTEMCATLNELDMSFNDVELDGYKVGGYIAVCNALLEDSDPDLASEIISNLGKAIGIALDKAILYGTGTKMPMGIMTRLAQTTEPETRRDSERPWVNLSATNIIKINATSGLDMFKEIIKGTGAAKGKYSMGAKFWAMNETTQTTLVAEALSINAAGAIATGMNQTMPVVGGAIEILEFIPDNVIIGGFGDLYILAERAGTQIAQSEHCRFVEDQTVFKGTARYDGVPVIPEGFVAIGLAGTTPIAGAVTFAEDKANGGMGAAMVRTRAAKE